MKIPVELYDDIERLSADDDDNPELLHVYGQEAWHDNVHIVGTRRALEELRGTVDEALCGVPHTMDAFVNDGEGYSVRVYLLEGGWNTESWKRLAVPYSGDHAEEKRELAIMPWNLR